MLVNYRINLVIIVFLTLINMEKSMSNFLNFYLFHLLERLINFKSMLFVIKFYANFITNNLNLYFKLI